MSATTEQDARQWRAIAITTITVVAAVIAALSVRHLPHSGPVYLLAGPLLVIVIVAVARFGAVGCLAALVVGTCLGFSTYSKSVGGVSLRVTDIPYVLLVGAAFIQRQGQRSTPSRDIGQRYLAVLLGVFGLSLVPVLAAHNSAFSTDVVSWLRFVQSLSLVWLIPYVLPTANDRRRFVGIVIVGTGAELVRAIGHALLHPSLLSGRLAGGSPPDTEGLLAAILIITVIYSKMPRAARWRWSLIALGVAGLLMTRSVGAIIAAGLVIGLVSPPWNAGSGRSRRAALTRPAQLIALLLVTVSAVAAVRPQELPGRSAFEQSTAFNRIILGTAGVELFVRHPVLGVGWRQSSLPSVIGAPDVSSSLHRLYPKARPDFFPAPTQTTSVHNAYIQILSDTGLVGLAALLFAFVAMFRRLRWWRTILPPDPEDRGVLTSAGLVLLAVLIWWNDNPLFGAQPETILAAFALGMLACRYLRKDSAVQAPAQPPPAALALANAAR